MFQQEKRCKELLLGYCRDDAVIKCETIMQMVVIMIRMFKGNAVFYMKNLALYGVLLAVLHCPSMQYEQNDTKYQFDLNESDMLQVVGKAYGEGFGEATYNYAKMMSLVQKCRRIEENFRLNAEAFVHDKGRIVAIKKVLTKLNQERERFADYAIKLAGERDIQSFKNGKKSRKSLRYLCEQYTSKKKPYRQERAVRYYLQVILESIETLESIIQRLEYLQAA